MNFISIWSMLVRVNDEFVFPDPEPPIINILYGWSGICGQFGLFFLCFFSFFYNIIQVKHFLYCFIVTFNFFFLTY